MNYNFDPERWYDKEIDALKAQLKSGAITRQEFEIACDQLQEDYDKMLDRLNGQYDYFEKK